MLDGAVHSVKIIEAVAIARNLKKSDRRTISKLAPVMMGYKRRTLLVIINGVHIVMVSNACSCRCQNPVPVIAVPQSEEQS